jgi:hypothetical protein
MSSKRDKSEMIEVINQSAVAKIAPAAITVLAPKEWDFSHCPGGYVTTMPTETMSDKIAVYNALSTSQSMWEECDTVIRAVNVIFSSGQTPGTEEGESEPCIVTTVLDEDGVPHRTCSKYAYRAIALVMMLVKAPPWSPPVCMVPRRKKSPTSGRPYLAIEVQG